VFKKVATLAAVLPATRAETSSAGSRTHVSKPAISVIVINYNGARWLEPALASLGSQTIADQLEVIVVDNDSPDQSGELATKLMRNLPRRQVLRNEVNLGYGEGNNLAAKQAQGRYLLFLNNDVWLEPDCLEQLLRVVAVTQAAAASPLIMDYVNDTIQSVGGSGFDVFGFSCGPLQCPRRPEVLVASGSAMLVERNLFQELGGFDGQFFMYAEEYDLCWRIWLAGKKVVLAPLAKLHHRGAANVNPHGHQSVLEHRTSDTKRYYANRNNLLVLLKNCQHLLLIMVPLQIVLLAVEALVTGAVVQRWSYLRRAYLEAIRDCWRLRRHIFAERRRVRNFRRRSDFWMLRFLQPGLNRWQEFWRFKRFGFPKVDSK
jgi:GT2 family glycosyltransferase